jgi:hypothetical protein
MEVLLSLQRVGQEWNSDREMKLLLSLQLVTSTRYEDVRVLVRSIRAYENTGRPLPNNIHSLPPLPFDFFLLLNLEPPLSPSPLSPTPSFPRHDVAQHAGLPLS